jgi:serine protease Do
MPTRNLEMESAMIRLTGLLVLLLALLLPASLRAADATSSPAPQASGASTAELQSLYDKVTPSLVAVQYVWENELGRRELVGAGIVVSDDGTIMTSLGLFDTRIPDAQMKEFKILVPSQEHEADEIDATFVGRDERTGTAFVRPKSPHKWPVLKFDPGHVKVGDEVISIGLLPKSAAYKTYLTRGTVSAVLRGETPQVLILGGNLAAIGSPVFTADGKAIGFVNSQPEQFPFLNAPDPRGGLGAISSPPLFFTPAYDLLQSIQDPPIAGEPQKLPWLGIPESAMAGLNKDVAESMGLKDQPAVEVGDVIPGSPLQKAGIKPGDIIVKVNGKPLERGDQPEELPGILARQIRRMKVGQDVTLSVLRGKGEPLKDIKVHLTERPQGPNRAERFYAEDLGFGVRAMVFIDSYARKLPADTKGVVVSVLKPQGSAAAAKLQREDLITEMNGKPVTGLKEFKKAYEEFRKKNPHEALVLVVMREGNTQTIRIEPPQ